MTSLFLAHKIVVGAPLNVNVMFLLPQKSAESVGRVFKTDTLSLKLYEIRLAVL